MDADDETPQAPTGDGYGKGRTGLPFLSRLSGPGTLGKKSYMLEYMTPCSGGAREFT